MLRNNIDINVGERVKKQRLLRDVDISDIALLIGVTADQMRKYESGVSRITAKRLQQIAAALCVDIGCFFDGIAELSPSVAAEQGQPEPLALTPDAFELNRVFVKVKDPASRRRIIEFAISLAADEAIGGNLRE